MSIDTSGAHHRGGGGLAVVNVGEWGIAPLAFRLLYHSCFPSIQSHCCHSQVRTLREPTAEVPAAPRPKPGDQCGNVESQLQPTRLLLQRRRERLPPPFHLPDFTQVHFIGRTPLSRESVKYGSWASSTCKERDRSGCQECQPTLSNKWVGVQVLLKVGGCLQGVTWWGAS